MGNFFSSILIKIAGGIFKAMVIACLMGGCGLLMLFASVDIINFLETGQGYIFQFFQQTGPISQEEEMEILLMFFSTVKRVVPGDELLGKTLGLNDFFDTLNFDFFIFLNDTITAIKENAIENQRLSTISQPLLREFAAITISSFVMVEVLRLAKLFFKFGGISMMLGLIYGAIYWIAASYAVSECILLFIDKMIIGNLGQMQNTSICYVIVILTFIGLEILIGAFAGKGSLLASFLLTGLNILIEFIKTALAWYFIKTITAVIKAVGDNTYINYIELYSKITVSLLLCFIIFILFIVLQSKLQKDPTKKDFEGLGIVKWFSKIFKK